MAKKVVFRISGLDNTVSNVNRMLDEVRNKTTGGLLEGAEYIRKDMQVTPPLVPEDTKALNKSWQAKPFSFSKIKPVVEAGFTIDYAVYVHENTNSAVNWSRINSGPKFLELGLKRNKTEVVNIVAAHINVDK